jgi:hypothetical protein
MIGTGSLVSAAGGVILVAAILGGGGPNPATGLRAGALVRERAGDAAEAVDALRAEVREALDVARASSGRVVAGDEPAGEPLAEAAATLDAAEDEADAVVRALASLEAAMVADGRAASGLPAVIGGAELRVIADDLRGAASRAEDAAEMRRAAESLLVDLEAALEALVGGRYAEAARSVAAARAGHGLILGAAPRGGVLGVWLTATDEMITAVSDLIDASASGDAAASAAAAAQFDATASQAATADRALAIAVSEAADAAGVPLRRLAEAAATLDDAHAALAAEAGSR